MSYAFLRKVFPGDVPHLAGFHHAIRRSLPDQGCVLDLGCGINTDLEGYRRPGREVWGTDFQEHPELHHREWFRLLQQNGTIPFPDSHFDCVVSSMVMEHVQEPLAFFGEIARVLRPGGRYIGHTISGSHYVTLIRRAFGVLPEFVTQALVKRIYGRAEVDTFPTFYRVNSERRVRRFAGEARLNLIRVRRYADPGYFRFAKPLEILAILTDRLMDGLHAGWGRLYMTVTLEKSPVSRTT